MVNGISLSATDFGAPDPHGPVVNGEDLFKKSLEEAFMNLTANAGEFGAEPPTQAEIAA